MNSLGLLIFEESNTFMLLSFIQESAGLFHLCIFIFMSFKISSHRIYIFLIQSTPNKFIVSFNIADDFFCYLHFLVIVSRIDKRHLIWCSVTQWLKPWILEQDSNPG